MTTYLLDSSAVLAWLFSEKGAEIVDPALTGGAITTANLAEVVRRAEQRGYLRGPAELTSDLAAVGLAFEETLTEADARRAAALIAASYAERGSRGTPALSLGDGICIAVGERLALPVLTADTAWKDLEDLFRTPVTLIR
ncbi:ribonuclease VapC [Streptomyces sp. V4I8]|uniref:PIN domain-containing protein n=1 Tax=Streptomyces sp. V4I8 TaxID=3156469 RepID=UPI003518C8C5